MRTMGLSKFAYVDDRRISWERWYMRDMLFTKIELQNLLGVKIIVSRKYVRMTVREALPLWN